MKPALTVLVAADDEGHATLVRRNLARAGLDAKAVRVRDGQELLDYLCRRGAWQRRPHHDAVVVLLDLNMPRLGGLEVLDRMKAEPQLAHIPVFVLTTTDNPAEIHRCYGRGASVCLVKPVDYGAFGDMVRRLGELLAVVNPPSEAFGEAPCHAG